MTAALVTNSTAYISDVLDAENISQYAITAQAANRSVARPVIALRNAFGDKIEVNLTNISSYSANTVFDVYVGNAVAFKGVKLSSIKKNHGFVSIYHNGKTNIKANTYYKIRFAAIANKKNSGFSNTVTTKTAYASCYYFKKGAPVYAAKNGKMIKVANANANFNVKGVLATDNGAGVAGKDKKFKGTYIKVLEGAYKGKYVRFSDRKLARITVEEYKRRVVSAYAASMNGGSYVYGGASYRATDCSGLTMLAYKQIGVNLPHSSNAQGRVGKAVSRYNMKAGDILVLNGGSHVAMYIGNNKIVHAMNSYDGIKVQHVSNLQYYSISTIRRVI